MARLYQSILEGAGWVLGGGVISLVLISIGFIIREVCRMRKERKRKGLK